jgi:hypothetical protein
MSHHLRLLRCVPSLVAVTEDPHAVVRFPIPLRRVRSAVAMNAAKLPMLDEAARRRGLRCVSGWAARSGT